MTNRGQVGPAQARTLAECATCVQYRSYVLIMSIPFSGFWIPLGASRADVGVDEDRGVVPVWRSEEVSHSPTQVISP
ncbi:MAG: hypothetical protein QOJ59_2796 [Thermomicrobiales bacterium]|nr:hypothetical protein [Thermomicrobiales bacterium]